MTNETKVALQTLELERMQILELEARIAQQDELIDRLERDGEREQLGIARFFRSKMAEQAERIKRNLVEAETSLPAQEPLDEAVMDKVTRDTPL